MSEDHKPGTADVDGKNRAAPHVNPEKSGIRSGNPQLDPDHASKRPTPRSERNPVRK
jgi:hypothetical protein